MSKKTTFFVDHSDLENDSWKQKYLSSFDEMTKGELESYIRKQIETNQERLESGGYIQFVLEFNNENAQLQKECLVGTFSFFFSYISVSIIQYLKIITKNSTKNKVYQFSNK